MGLRRRQVEVRLQQVEPGPDVVRPIFDMPIFKGRRSAEEPEIAGRPLGAHALRMWLVQILDNVCRKIAFRDVATIVPTYEAAYRATDLDTAGS